MELGSLGWIIDWEDVCFKGVDILEIDDLEL